MGLSKTLKGIAMAGVSNSLRAVQYSRQRDAVEKQFAAPPAAETYTTPGKLLGVDGQHFKFERAELRVEFLTADMARLTWTPGAEPMPYALARTDWPGTEVAHTASAAKHELKSGALALTLWADGSVHFGAAEGNAAGTSLCQHLPPERRGAEPRGAEWRQRSRLNPDEQLYGLGERAARLNLRGGRYQLWNQDAGGIYTHGHDPLYLSMPLFMGQHAVGTYLVFHENTHAGWFDARGESEAEISFEGGALRYYLVVGTPAQLVERYTELTGRPPLPPRWALGYHHCVVAYKTEVEVQAAAEGMRTNNLPISVIHMDLDYMDGYRTFTIDAGRFPNLKTIAADFETRGIKLVTIIDTAVKLDPDYRVYSEGLAEDVFCKSPEGEVLQAPVWPGWAVFPDFTDAKARAWWGRYYPLFLESGISGFWHDMNEPAAFTAWGDRTIPRPTRHTLEGRGGDHTEAHNIYALNMNRAGYDALRQLQPDKRPWLLTRAGFAGIQRYAWSWTGDTACEWSALRQTVATVLGLGLCGAPFTGPDTGGFHGNPSPELYTRWFQLSAFLPFFRTMSAFTTPRREPWNFGEPALTIARDFLKLRYRLLPYWYTLAWQTSQTGHPLARPLFWDSADPAHWAIDDEFLLGEALLVAPVLDEGTRSRNVILPRGRWYCFWDNTIHNGPSVIHQDAPLERMPLFARAGSVVPLEEAPGELALHLYVPPEDDEHFSHLYCDAGDGYGAALANRFRVRWVNAALEVAWEREGDYAWPYTSIEVHVHGAQVEIAEAEGTALATPEHLRFNQPFTRLELRFAD